MTTREAIQHGKEQLDVFGGTHKEFIEMAIEALQKQIPKRPVGASYGLVCPTCESYVYDPDWETSTKRRYYTEWCLCCGQRFTPLGRHLGDWAEEVDT